MNKRDNIRKEKQHRQYMIWTSNWVINWVDRWFCMMTRKHDFITIYMRASRVTSEKKSKSKRFQMLRSVLYHINQNKISLIVADVRVDCSLVWSRMWRDSVCLSTSVGPLHNKCCQYIWLFCLQAHAVALALGLAITHKALQEIAYGHWWNHNHNMWKKLGRWRDGVKDLQLVVLIHTQKPQALRNCVANSWAVSWLNRHTPCENLSQRGIS